MAALINVCGASFSGTTMLDLMLGNADDAFSCGEAFAWFRPWRTHHFEIRCSCDSVACPWVYLKDLPESCFHKGVVERLGVRFVIDSAKDLCWVADSQAWAARAGMQVFNVLIWKDPCELAHSYWKRSGSITAWRQPFVRYHRRFFSLGLPHTTIKLAELRRDPSDCLTYVCQRVGMPYFPGKENFWTRTHHTLFGNLGVREQVESGSSSIPADPVFEPAYLEHYDRVKRAAAEDQEVQEIVALLDGSRGRREEQTRFVGRPFRPIWYYKERGKRFIRRRFPEKADPSWR